MKRLVLLALLLAACVASADPEDATVPGVNGETAPPSANVSG